MIPYQPQLQMYEIYKIVLFSIDNQPSVWTDFDNTCLILSHWGKFVCLWFGSFAFQVPEDSSLWSLKKWSLEMIAKNNR